MKIKITPALFLLLSLALPSVALHAQSPVTFPSGDATAQGFLYLPSSSGPHPAVVVIQEWWGVNDWVKEQAQHFANEGYVALAVDLYRGKVATDADMAHELMRGLPQDRGVRDLTSAVAWLDHRHDVDPHRIGAIGWCMGGGYAAQLAVADPRPQSGGHQLWFPAHRQIRPRPDSRRRPRQLRRP